MEAPIGWVAADGNDEVNLWHVVRSVITGRTERWNPKADDTMRFLRRETVLATREANRMRRERTSWESLFRGYQDRRP